MATEPLTPQDCDLRDFAFMPLDVVRLRDSDLAATETPEACWAAVLLWCASWHQIPAASLPDDDRVLANLAGFGRVVKEWKRVKLGALRGWILCNDGRLYHPVIAEKALDAWSGKQGRKWRTECARIKKHAQRYEIPYLPPEFNQWIADGCPQGQPLHVPEMSLGTTTTCPEGQPLHVPEMSLGKSTPKGKGKGKEQGKEQGKVNNKKPTASAVLAALGVDQTVADDWIQLRKTKKATITQTALDGIQREAEKAEISMTDALRICCERGWAGFDSSWDWRSKSSGNTGRTRADQIARSNEQVAVEFLAGNEKLIDEGFVNA